MVEDEGAIEAPVKEECSTEVLICGSTKWDLLGRSSVPKSVAARGGGEAGSDHLGPCRMQFKDLPDGTIIRDVYSGPLAAHAVLVDADGLAYAFGRNDTGQLGTADLRSHTHPIPLKLPSKPSTESEPERVVQAACGKGHTILVTSAGRAFACGLNVHGQLGIDKKTDLRNPGWPDLTQVEMPAGERVVYAAAGKDFSVFASESGGLFTAGSGEFGQLGNGRTGESIETGNRLEYDFMRVAGRVPGFADGEGAPRIVQVAAGANHALALDDAGHVWSWGAGGYGRLGHKKPDDELKPRMIETLAQQQRKIDFVACGQTCSYAVARSITTLYMWGVTKPNREATMYPKPEYDLQGWAIRSIAIGASSAIVAAESSTITWGASPTFGELGYGEGKPKSSTKPKLVDAVEGLTVSKVAMGLAFSVMVVQVNNDEDQKILDKLKVEGVGPNFQEAVPAPKAPATKGKKRKRKAK